MGCALCEEHRAKGQKFCSECGTRLAAASPASPVERRQITVLFYDLVGSTQLSNACDAEDFREAIHAFHEIVTGAVKPYQAFVGAHVGDGGIVYFGYPVAHDDAAECAVLAALALAKAVTDLTLPDGRKAQARTGIATGTGVVGRIEDGDTGNSAVGAVTSLAARLQGQCEPGQTVISGTTRKMLGQLFELDDLGHLEAKGIAGGAQAFRVNGRSRLDRFEALHDGTITLIGRQAERAVLDKAWADATGQARVDASSGEGGHVLVSAEAGVGKSRFALEFARELGANGAGRITLFCTPHSRRSALRPFVTYLRRRVRQVAGEAHGERVTLEGLRAAIAPQTSDRDFTLLARLLDFDPPAVAELESLTATQLLDTTIDVLIDQIARWSRINPIVLLFEDLHWADPTTLSLLARALAKGGFGRTLTVMTARPEFDAAVIGLQADDHLLLEPFLPGDASQLIGRILGGKASDAMIAAITERANGVPLFIEELTRSVLDQQALVRADKPNGDDAAYELADEFVLPETLQDSLLARLDALGPAKRVAQIAAVVGRLFPAQIVADLLVDDSADVTAGCAALEAAGMIVPRTREGGGFGVAGEGEYLFRHVLIQEFAYSTLVKQDRKHFNGRLLDALEAASAGARDARDDPEQMAHYAQEAGRTARAVHYWHLAGLQALAQSAMPEAEDRLRCGLALLPQIADKTRSAQLELDLQLALGRVLLARHGHASEEIGRTFERAGVLAREVGDRRQVLAALHGSQAHDLQHSRMVSARNRSAEMLQLAEADGDDVWAVIGYRSRGIASFPLGNYRQSADDLGDGLQLLRTADLDAVRAIVVDDINAAMQIYRSWSLIFLGRREEGRALAAEALARASDLGQPYTLAFANIGNLYSRLMRGDLENIEDWFGETFALCEQHDIWYFMATARIFQGWYRTMIGDRRAAATVAEGMVDYRKTGSILYQPTYMHWQALAHLYAGELDEARTINDWTIETSAAHQMHHQMGEYYGLRAVLQDQGGESDAARKAMVRAQEITDGQGAVHCADINDRLWMRYGLRGETSGLERQQQMRE